MSPKILRRYAPLNDIGGERLRSQILAAFFLFDLLVGL